MKIALLSPLPDPERGSMSLYRDEFAAALRRELNPADHCVVFPGPGDEKNWDVDLRKPLGKWRRYWQQYVRYGIEARRLNADIYHILDHGYANAVRFLPSGKTVVTFHDALLPNLGRGTLPVSHRPRRAIWAQERALGQLKRAARVIADSEFARSELLRFSQTDKTKISVVPLGVEGKFFEPVPEMTVKALREKWGAGGKLTVLLAGRTDPHKNIEGTLAILRDVSFVHSVPLRIVKTGSPFTESQLRLIDSLDLRGSLVDLGRVAARELPAVYRACDALVLLSWYEGFGLPPLEAMAAGIPVIVSNRASLPEIVGDAALITDPADREGSAEKIGRFLTDAAARAACAAKGKIRAGQYSWRRTALDTLRIYRELFEETR